MKMKIEGIFWIMDLSPTQYLSLSLPVLQLAGEGRSVLGDDHDQEVAVLAVRGKHRPLLADLAPVAARAGQGQRGERHVVHARLGELHTDTRQVVHRDGTRLARQVAETPENNLNVLCTINAMLT